MEASCCMLIDKERVETDTKSVYHITLSNSWKAVDLFKAQTKYFHDRFTTLYNRTPQLFSRFSNNNNRSNNDI